LSDQRVVAIGAPILLVIHIPSQRESLIAQILSRETMLPAKQVVDGERARNGVIYVAAPDKHLLIEEDGTLRSVHGPRENRHRPRAGARRCRLRAPGKRDRGATRRPHGAARPRFRRRRRVGARSHGI